MIKAKKVVDENFKNEMVVRKVKKEFLMITGMLIIILITNFFINQREIIKSTFDLLELLNNHNYNSILDNIEDSVIVLLILSIYFYILFPIILPIYYVLKKDNIKLEKETLVVNRVRVITKEYIEKIIICFLTLLTYIFLVVVFGGVYISQIISYNKIIALSFFSFLLSLFFKNYTIKYLVPCIVITFLIIHIIDKESSVYLLIMFISFMLILVINSIKYKRSNIINLNLQTMHIIIEEKIDELNDWIKIKNKSIMREIISLLFLCILGGNFFTNNTMMIADNVLMKKIINETVCNDCEKGIYFVLNKDINNNVTINNIIEYAIFNRLIDLSYKKNSLFEHYKKEKYVIKEYNIPEYYVSFNFITYTFGIITSIENSQTKNYTHNNIITEYIILLYSIIGKILIGILAYKVYLIKNESSKT